MKTYDVTIRATVTKTIRVQAENEDTAYEIAHEAFSVCDSSDDERYDQETEAIEEITEELLDLAHE